MLRQSLAGGLLTMTLALLPMVGHSQELIVNGNFASDTSGWFRFRSVAFEPGEDLNEAPDSGSVRITNEAGGNVAFFTNVPITVAQPYVLQFSTKNLFGPTALPDPIRVLVQYRFTSDCVANNVIETENWYFEPRGSDWNTVEPLAVVLDAPASTQCIHLSFRLAVNEFPGYFLDGVSLKAEQVVLAQDRVFIDGFE